MRTAVALVLLLVCVGPFGRAGADERSAVALEREVQRVNEGRQFWPGYDPLAVPLAIFDGTNTFLFRHPTPPEGFVEGANLHVLEGRHAAVVANSSAQIGGVSTATVMLESLPPENTLSEWAAVVVHEAFHVFQGSTGRRWGANEVDLFLYPVDDAALLTLRRLETEALGRAFAARDRDIAAGWAQCALDLRHERFDGMDPAFQAYERGIETHEGTATYVEYGVTGRTRPDFPAEGFDAEDVRSRAYTTGVAWALLLDRFDPNWRDGFDGDESRHLYAELAEAPLLIQETPQDCVFTAPERTEAARVAREDVERLLVQRTERRGQFESLPGWQIIVQADETAPLWPQGFDPLNVHRVDGGVLHTRFLKLGNESGALEVMGDTVLTEEVGPHPLFNGVHRLVSAGLETEPQVEIEGEHVRISSPSFTADFTGASVHRSGSQVIVSLAPRGK
ncbi:MAG: hypothetical protein KAW67_10800 [Candidatus Eisenbacteria sp.]|nr:hypothetical protein [Candidatus Eisenbacteria bacterium]